MTILDDDRPVLTIRKSTAEERAEKFPPLMLGRARQRIPKYVVVAQALIAEHMHICSVFGIPQGGDTRAEAVFWAERFASKNDYRYLAPKGWENVQGQLKEAAHV